MTLNLTIINRWGIWQSSDHRLTDTATGRVVDDDSIKHVILRCPDGAALLAYAGAGRINNLDLSDWIRETLRGETRSLDQSFILIRENATRDLAPLLRANNIHHMFSIGAFLNGRPWAIQIRNFHPSSGARVLNHFDTVAKNIDGMAVGLAFGGGPDALAPGDQQRLMATAARKPRTPREFRNFLAAINRRAAKTKSGKKTISPGCITSCIPPVGEPAECEFHERSGALKPLVIPLLLFGIDLTEMQRGMLGGVSVSGAHNEAISNEGAEHPGKQAVLPRNRLRR